MAGNGCCIVLSNQSVSFRTGTDRIFELAPTALNMYSFGPEFVGNEESLYQSPKFKVHAKGVVSMLDKAVNMLGPDLEPALISLSALGGRHFEYGVLPAHYGIVGEALLCTLKTALGDKWTPRVENGWTIIYGMMSTAMITGAERRIEQKQRLMERKQKKPIKQEMEKSEDTSFASPTARRKRRGIKISVTKLLSPITGMRRLHRTIPDNSRQVAVSNMLNKALSISSDASSSMGSGSTCTPADPSNDQQDDTIGDQTIELVYKSWDKVREIPNYEEVAGVLLFQK